VHSAVGIGLAALIVALTGIAAWAAPLLAAVILAIAYLAQQRL
jgi:hypothetical protein